MQKNQALGWGISALPKLFGTPSYGVRLLELRVFGSRMVFKISILSFIIDYGLFHADLLSLELNSSGIYVDDHLQLKGLQRHIIHPQRLLSGIFWKPFLMVLSTKVKGLKRWLFEFR